MASDPRRLFVSISDVVQLFDEAAAARGDPLVRGGLPPGKSGIYALDPATGAYRWRAPAPQASCKYVGDRSQDYAKGDCIRAMSAPPAVMKGAVFQGSLDGWLRAYDPATGKVLSAYSTTAQTYATTNGVTDQLGGGFDGVSGGPVLASGMMYVVSGFNGASRTGGNGNNVLLAFSVDGR